MERWPCVRFIRGCFQICGKYDMRLVIGNHGSSFFFFKSAFGVNFDVTMSPIRFDCDMTTTEPTMLIDPSIDFQGGNEMKTCLSTQTICFLFFWALLKLMGKVDCNGFRSNARKMTTPILPHYLFLWILGTLPLPSSRMFAVDGLDLLFLYQSACKHLRRLWSTSWRPRGFCKVWSLDPLDMDGYGRSSANLIAISCTSISSCQDIEEIEDEFASVWTHGHVM